MKKTILISFSILIFNLSHSQEKIGIFAGLNYSYFTDGILSQFLAENSLGLQIGALYEFEVNEKVAFRPKIAFSQQGDRTKTEQTGSLSLDKIDYELTYLNASLDFKFWDEIYLITGPQIGFLLDQKPLSNDLGKIDSTIDFGVNLGIGFKINEFFLELGLYQGLSTILEYESITGNTTKVKNGFAKFTLGYNL
ncbi:porin family protein [uncultured Algibacter sp.]|uniref:porin family protein n=1 Tax=uncultured Algibacter sp. TaxID=298659 RepID=UPI0026258AF1|nr:porin family protein [uncultured Algibacter sp.]